MKFDDEGRKALDLVQARAACKLAEIHRLLAPGLVAPFSYDELQRMAEGRMAEMSPAEREKLRGKAIVAYAELRQLMDEMSRYLADIGEELNKVTRHSQATGAYSQARRPGARQPYAL